MPCTAFLDIPVRVLGGFYMADRYALGDVVRLKKQHPCGGFEWKVIRLGADVKLRCLGCGRMVILEREELYRRTRAITPDGDQKRG